VTALPLNASLPAGPARSHGQPDAAAHGLSQSSPFPALFGDMMVADGQSDAAPLKSDAAPLKKGAATPPRSGMPLIQIELIQTELIQTENAPAAGAPGVALPATAEPPATASAATTPVPDSLPEGPSTITAEQIGRPAGRYQLPAGNPFTFFRPAPGEFEVASPSMSRVTVALADPSGLSQRPTVVSWTRGQAEPPRAADAETPAKMNLPGLPVDLPGLPVDPPGLPVAQTPAPLFQIESHTTEFNTGESRQPVLPLRAGTPIDASVRVNTVSTLESGAGETAGLAFAARLVPIAATATAATAQPTASEAPPLPRAVPDAPPRPTATGNPALIASASNDKEATAAMTPSGGAADRGGGNPPTAEQDSHGGLPDRSRKNQEPQPIADELTQTAVMGRVIPHTEYTPEPRVDTPSQTAASSTAESAQPKEGPGLPAATETAKPPAAARDIRLEIGGGDHRVEVRLMERGGEVHVDVRTPDTHLASTLREDLSALSSRLTESGFRTETWHPGASGAGEWHRQAEPSAGGTPQDPDSQQGQPGRDRQPGDRQPGDRQPQRQKVPEEQLNQEQKGKDFEWFISTLR